MKAVIEENTGRPLKIHDLVVLAKTAGLDAGFQESILVLSPYYIATRYPEEREELSGRTNMDVAKQLLQTAREVLEWAKKRLT